MWVVFLLVVHLGLAIGQDGQGDHSGLFTNTFVMEADMTDEEAKAVGARYGFVLEKRMFENFFLFRHPGVNKLARSSSKLKTRDVLKRFPKIQYFEQEEYQELVLENEMSISKNERIKRQAATCTRKDMPDEYWCYMEYLHDPHMGIQKAWQKGYTGRGIRVAVLDNGIDVNHDDLKKNLNMLYSHNFVLDSVNRNSSDPSYVAKDRHGTNVAGIISAESNRICIPGVAHEASFSALKMMEVNSTDGRPSKTADALVHKINEGIFDIYSNSCGMPTKGEKFLSLSSVAKRALENGISNGRNGKGAIYTFSGGNYRRKGDDCNVEGYKNSIYTITITSVNQATGIPAYYAQPCTAILASTYPGLITTTTNNTCRTGFHGTSAACPVASGIIALLLQKRGDLTWRDIQHLIVETSETDNLRCPSNETNCFTTNGIGKYVSHNFGFGLLNANKLLEKADTWVNVGAKKIEVQNEVHVDQTSTGSSIFSKFEVITSKIKTLEHVQVTLEFKALKRGHVEFYLTSPMNTTSRLLKARYLDTTTLSQRYFEWTFMTVHNWGEDPTGNWSLEMKAGKGYQPTKLQLKYWKLTLHGIEKTENVEEVLSYPNSTKSKCSFDTDICDWTQENTDHFDWKRIIGPSHEVKKTGPSAGYNGSGSYLYADAGDNSGKTTSLRSANFPVKDYCLSFYYHMDVSNNTDVGKLKLKINVGHVHKTLWSVSSGTSSWQFIQFEIELDPSSPMIEDIKVEGSLNFEFTATMGKNDIGDIALDNVNILPQACS